MATDTSREVWNQHLTIGVVVACLGLSILSICVRIYARMLSAAKIWYDDVWMCCVMLFCFAMTACDIIGLIYGSGKHQGTLPASAVQAFMKNMYAYMLLWTCGVFGVKVGILLFYRRVFPTRSFRMAVMIIGCFSLAAFLVNFFTFMLQCTPVSRFWDSSVSGSCIDQNAFYTASAIINVVGDVTVLILPIPVIWGLHTSRNKKVALSFLFLLGALFYGVCVASIFRIVAVEEIDPQDFTFSNVAGGLWSTVEVEIGFICANLPAIRPVINRCLGRKCLNGSSGTGSGPFRETGNISGYGVHSKVVANRNGKHQDDDIELMGPGNSTDEIRDTTGRDRPAGSNRSQSEDQGQLGVSVSGIHVQTEVHMAVDEWDGDESKKTGVATFASPV